MRTHPTTRTTFLADLGEPGYSLRLPLPIVVREDAAAGPVQASLAALALFGEGPTPAAAMAQLQAAILDLYEEMAESDPATLGDLSLGWLGMLREWIEQDQGREAGKSGGAGARVDFHNGA